MLSYPALVNLVDNVFKHWNNYWATTQALYICILEWRAYDRNAHPPQENCGTNVHGLALRGLKSTVTGYILLDTNICWSRGCEHFAGVRNVDLPLTMELQVTPPIGFTDSHVTGKVALLTITPPDYQLGSTDATPCHRRSLRHRN